MAGEHQMNFVLTGLVGRLNLMDIAVRFD